MVNPTDLRSDFNDVIKEVGVPITIKYWPSGVATYSGSDYDEEYLPTGSNAVGSATVISGLGYFVGIGPEEAQYLPQGKFTTADSKMFIHGSLTITNNALITDSNGNVFSVNAELGGIDYKNISGTNIFTKVYVRAIAGSYGVY